MGTGDDNFTVFRNRAELTLLGGPGDDMFTIRAFAQESSRTNINGQGGSDYIQYVANANIQIDGGTGNDTIKVIGTEFDDTFVITSDGIYGAAAQYSTRTLKT